MTGNPARAAPGAKPQISFEFFPPGTAEGRGKLAQTARRLGVFAPAFYSVTYGAGGSTRDRTLAAVAELRTAGFPAVPHLSWGGDDEDRVLALISGYRQLGVDRMVALRGDLPSGMASPGQVHRAEDLVRLIRARVDAPLLLHVAAYPEVHPEAPSPGDDIRYLKRKLEAGADGCITQYFYNADSYFHFRDRCAAAGIDAPLVPGIMPIAQYASLARFSAKAGVDIPRWLNLRLQELQDDQPALRAFGAEVVTALCQRLLDGGAPGLHFYTLNQAAPTEAVAANLGLLRNPRSSTR